MAYGKVLVDEIQNSQGTVFNVEAEKSKLDNLSKTDVGLGNVDNTSDADKPVSTATQTALAAKADLVDGVVPASQIPSIAVIDYLGNASDEAAMLALSGQKGDWARRLDTSTVWVITGDDPTDAASWTELTTAIPQSIDALTDVDTSTIAPAAGQALVWNAAEGKWIPGTVAAAGGGGGFDENFQEATVIQIDRQNPIAQTGTVTDRTVGVITSEYPKAYYDISEWSFVSGSPSLNQTFTLSIYYGMGWSTPSEDEWYRYTKWAVGTVFYVAQGNRSFTSQTISQSANYSWMKLEITARTVTSGSAYANFTFKVLDKLDYPMSTPWSSGGYYNEYSFVEFYTQASYEIEVSEPLLPERVAYSVGGSPAYRRRLYDTTSSGNTHFLEWKPTQAFKDYKNNQSLVGKQITSSDSWTLEFFVHSSTESERDANPGYFENWTQPQEFITLGQQYSSSLYIDRNQQIWFNNNYVSHPWGNSTGQNHHFAIVHNTTNSTVKLYIDGVYKASQSRSGQSWIGAADYNWDDPNKDWSNNPNVKVGKDTDLVGFRFTIGPDCPYITAGTGNFTVPKALTDATTATSFTLALLDGSSNSFDEISHGYIGYYYLKTFGDQATNLKTVVTSNSESDLDKVSPRYAFASPTLDNTASDGTSNTFVTFKDDFAIGDNFTFYRSDVPGVYLGPTESIKYDPLTNSTAISFVQSPFRTSSDGQVALEGITPSQSNTYQATAYGANTYNTGNSSTAIGYDVQAGGNAVGIGTNVEVQSNGISIGRNLTAYNGGGNIIVGNDITSDQNYLRDGLLLKTGAQKHYNFTLSDYISSSSYSRTGTIYLTFSTRANYYSTVTSVPTGSLFDLWRSQKHAVIYGTVVASISDDNGNCQVKKSEVCFSSTSLANQTSSSTSAWTVTEGTWTTIRTAGSGLSFTPNVLINSSNALTGKIVFGSTYTLNSSSSSGRTKLLTAMNFDLTVFE